MYLDKFLEYKDESVPQIVIQYVRLFPLARMRVSNQRMADRMELILKSMGTKFGKMQRVSYILSEITETLAKIRSAPYHQTVIEYLQDQDSIIESREVKIDQMEHIE